MRYGWTELEFQMAGNTTAANINRDISRVINLLAATNTRMHAEHSSALDIHLISSLTLSEQMFRPLYAVAMKPYSITCRTFWKCCVCCLKN